MTANQQAPLIAGVLGGMGPYATGMFFRTVLDLTPAKKDWEHIHLVIDNAVNIPSRTRYFLYDEQSPVPAMISCCKKLESYPVDFIVIPCNSAHYFLEQIVPHLNIPVLNMIEITASSIKRPGAHCAVLGGRITYASKSYKGPLIKGGHLYIEHDEALQEEVENIIESIKLNNSTETIVQKYRGIILRLKENYNINTIVLGCTELSTFKYDFDDITIIDSSEELAKATVKKALGRE